MLPSAAPVDASGNTPLHSPGDVPPAPSLTIDDPGDTPVETVGYKSANAHGDAPVPPTPAAFAPSPFAPSVGFPSFLLVLCQGPVELLHAAVGSTQLDASGGFDFEAHTRYAFAVAHRHTALVRRAFFEARAHYAFAVTPRPATLVPRVLFLLQHTLTNREPCITIPPRGVVIRGVKVYQFPSTGAAVTSLPRRSVAPHGPRAHRADGVPALSAEGGLISRLLDTPSGSRALPSAPASFTPSAAPFTLEDALLPRTDNLSLPPRGLLLGGNRGEGRCANVGLRPD
ncbi:hypothetical protein BC826DRAFT_1109135 [Russula brevipes]|nr:hypothetical protein BC826DRAFT_1109135 [Russula brevipes]